MSFPVQFLHTCITPSFINSYLPAIYIHRLYTFVTGALSSTVGCIIGMTVFIVCWHLLRALAFLQVGDIHGSVLFSPFAYIVATMMECYALRLAGGTSLKNRAQGPAIYGNIWTYVSTLLSLTNPATSLIPLMFVKF